MMKRRPEMKAEAGEGRLRKAGIFVVPSLVLILVCAVAVHVTYGVGRVEMVETGSVAKGNADLARAQRELWSAMPVSEKARQDMLLGIGGWGSGEEDDNNMTWEVAMHVDRGCQDILDLRAAGNPGWKRYPTNKCDPNKRVNPYMWPYDAPGQVWLHDSTDSTKTPDQWPYKLSDLHDHVHSSERTPVWADGIWHGAEEVDPYFDRRIAPDGYGVGGPPAPEAEEEETPPEVIDSEPIPGPAATDDNPEDTAPEFAAPMQSLADARPLRAQALSEADPWHWDGTTYHGSHHEKEMMMQHELRNGQMPSDHLGLWSGRYSASAPRAQALSEADPWHWDGTTYHGAHHEKEMMMQHELRNGQMPSDHLGLWSGRYSASAPRAQALSEADPWHWDGTTYHGAHHEKEMMMQHELRNGQMPSDHLGLWSGRYSASAPRAQALSEADPWHWDGTTYHGAHHEKQMMMQHELRNGQMPSDHLGLWSGRYSAVARRKE